MEFRHLDFKADEQRAAEFLAINPHGRVPVLVVDGVPIAEAPAVLLCIATLDTRRRLLPKLGSSDFGKCLQWVMWITSTLHIAIAQVWRPERFISGAVDRDAFVAAGLEKVQQHLRELEDAFRGPWMIGESYTISDCYMLPFYRFGELLGCDMTQDFPRLTAWKERMISRPAVQRALDREGLQGWRLAAA